jgi:hypothetical protein
VPVPVPPEDAGAPSPSSAHATRYYISGRARRSWGPERTDREAEGPIDAGIRDADAGPTVTLDWFGAAVFLDPAGNEFGRGNAPGSFALPDGTSITVGIGFETFTFVDVPAGATLHPFVDPPPPSTRQSIRIDIVDRPGATITASTGCSTASGPGVHELAIDDHCLEAERAELFIYAAEEGAGAYIQVKDIAIGSSDDPPLDVSLPDWTGLPAGDERVRVDVSGLPDAANAEIGLYALRGLRKVTGSTVMVDAVEGGGSATRLDHLLPTTGTHWVRSSSYSTEPAGELASRSYLTEPLESPLASPGAVDFATFLPIPTDLSVTLGHAPSVKFRIPDVPTAADIDRVVATFAWGDPTDPFLWHVVAKAGTTELAVPNIPVYLVTVPETLLWVEVRAEDHHGVNGWSEALNDWHDTYLFLSPERWPSGRLSRAVWTPPPEPTE